MKKHIPRVSLSPKLSLSLFFFFLDAIENHSVLSYLYTLAYVQDIRRMSQTSALPLRGAEQPRLPIARSSSLIIYRRYPPISTLSRLCSPFRPAPPFRRSFTPARAKDAPRSGKFCVYFKMLRKNGDVLPSEEIHPLPLLLSLARE